MRGFHAAMVDNRQARVFPSLLASKGGIFPASMSRLTASADLAVTAASNSRRMRGSLTLQTPVVQRVGFVSQADEQKNLCGCRFG
jgi:hypothetical protein